MTDEPVVIPTASRPARIAALHAAGLWLAENIDVPMPDKVDMTRWDVTVEQLHAISQLHGEPIQYGGTHQWVEIKISLETLHGIEISYTAFGPSTQGQCPESLNGHRCANGAGHAGDHSRWSFEQQTTPMDLPPRGQGIHTDPWVDVMPADPRDTPAGY